MTTSVDAYFNDAEKWKKELQQLRKIILDCGLTEELKWGVPIYTFQKKNIVGINGLKDNCALAFFKGALLQDTDGILSRPGDHTQAGRWVKFSSTREVVKMAPVLKSYIYEAIEIEKAGLKIVPKKTSDFKVPEEFQERLDVTPSLKAAFDALTPGRQRGYLLYFSAPKQSKTRSARVEKYMKHILSGKGIDD